MYDGRQFVWRTRCVCCGPRLSDVAQQAQQSVVSLSFVFVCHLPRYPARSSAACDFQYYHPVVFSVRFARPLMAGTFSSTWMLPFDIICRHAEDMPSMGVNSIQHQNHLLCLCIIPSKTDREKVYTDCFPQIQQVEIAILDAKHCGRVLRHPAQAQAV